MLRMLRIGDRAGEILVTDAVRCATGEKYRFTPIDEVPSGAKAAYRLEILSGG